ncbi:hypothetical protein CYL15_12750 [Geobacillus thermodenitrificans]|jgi:hypothetical protein|nr:hypothetical protein [Geobacillus thermodenitrificans]
MLSPLQSSSILNFTGHRQKLQSKKNLADKTIRKALSNSLSPPSAEQGMERKKEKGEEKPEEELMGKRKSSPSLATTPLTMLPLLIMDGLPILIHRRIKNSSV